MPAGDDLVMELKPNEDEVERFGDPIPDKVWKEGVEDEWARPVLPLAPGTNSVIFPTDDCKENINS